MSVPKLAAFGAFGASAGLLLLFVGFIWLITPRFTGGIDGTQATVSGIAVGFVFAVLIAVHLIYGKVLWDESTRGRA